MASSPLPVTIVHSVFAVEIRNAAPATSTRPPSILTLPARIEHQCCRSAPRTSRRDRIRQHHLLDPLAQFHHAQAVDGADRGSGPAANRGDERIDLVGQRVAFAELDLLSRT